jgi:hypothetical protein
MNTQAIVKTESRAETRASDVLAVATAISEELIALHDFYGKHFPYDKGKLIKDLGLLLLFGMTGKIVFEFFEIIGNQKVEKLSYAYLPESVPEAVNSQPGDFPRHEILPYWQVRVVSYYTTSKPESEVREFHNQLGWLPVDALTRTGQGTTERSGEFVSGNFTVAKEVYKALQDKTSTDQKERTAHEIN